MPQAASAVAREHVENYLADMFERTVGRGREPKPVAPATVAKHYRSLQQFFR